MKYLKSIGLVLGTLAVFTVVGTGASILIWLVLSVLFIISRFSKPRTFFVEWSWIQFVVTISAALGIPYVWLILSAGF